MRIAAKHSFGTEYGEIWKINLIQSVKVHKNTIPSTKENKYPLKLKIHFAIKM